MRSLLIALAIGAMALLLFWEQAGSETDGSQPAASAAARGASESSTARASADQSAQPRDASAKRSDVQAPQLTPRAMPRHSFATPHGRGLAAWQAFYEEAERFEGGMLNAGAPGFAWWFTDPEMVELYHALYDEKLEELILEFELRRSRESDPSQIDPGSRAFEANLVRYQEELEAIGFQPDWFRTQEPRSDVARHLSNYLVLQARTAQSGKQFDLDGPPRYRFNAPLSQVVERAAGLDMGAMESGRVNTLLDDYANVVLQAAEIRSAMQIYEAASIQAARHLKFPAFSVNQPDAPFSDELLGYQAELGQLWDDFVLRVQAGE